MINYNSESLKSLIIYYNNSKAQTQSYKNRYFDIKIKSGGDYIKKMSIFYTTKLLFINMKHNTVITLERSNFSNKYLSCKIDDLDPKLDYSIE